ncbi:site-specific integrase [Frankia sp. R82]|uniref:site-specific integrase n=1 Tax=Frankia sp. R82 TaxID=2950553 RepID=UPI0020439F4F|nr:site-specific integrase [Frankia sp. R82]MCM3885488.1 site-specific integrase [Frankia sp. R82]
MPKELVPLVGKAEISDSGFATKKQAEVDGEKAMARVRSGRQHIGNLTVGAYLRDWHSRKNALRPTTSNRYEQFIRLHLVPTLGEMPLSALRADHIDTALKKAAGRGRPIGPATVADVFEMLKTALNDALKQRMVDFNPAIGVELPAYTAREVEPWEADEVGAFLDEAASDRLAAMYELIALHGLRRGEACGAAWTGLDEERSVLTITKQIVKNDTEYGVWAPKTRSGRRKVDLDSTTLGALLGHRLVQDDERDAVGPGWDNGVLPDEHGQPVQLRNLMFTRPDGTSTRSTSPGGCSRSPDERDCVRPSGRRRPRVATKWSWGSGTGSQSAVGRFMSTGSPSGTSPWCRSSGCPGSGRG